VTGQQSQHHAQGRWAALIEVFLLRLY